MNDEEFEKDELEYNDGLGDLLREKEQIQFSWGKTIGVIAILAFLIAAGLWAFFKTSGNTTPHETPNPAYLNEQVDLPDYIDDKQDHLDAQTDAKIDTLNIKAPEEVEVVTDEQKEVDQMIKQLMNKNASKNKVAVPAVSMSTSTPTIYRIIAGSFTTKANADNLVNTLSGHKIPAFVRTVSPTKFHVQAGAFSSHDKAKRHVKRLKHKGVDAYIVTKQ